jgi:hypothetical protein
MKIFETGAHRPMYLCMIVLLVSSCAAQISGRVDQAGAGTFTVNAGLKPRFSTLIRSFKALAGEQDGAIIDGPLIASSLTRAPGIASVSFRNTSPTAIEGPVNISAIGDFLAPGGATGFIRFERGPGSQGGRCTITISLETGPKLLSLISPEIAEYLEALMAPIATGDAMTEAEYLKAVADMYGEGLSTEIAEASIQTSIDFPGPIQSVTNGKFNGRRAEFDIPLRELLVLERPLHYEVLWR